MKKVLMAFGSLLLAPAALLAEERINVFPPSPFDRSVIYIDLALFWIAIIVLIVLIRMKLREIEHAQAMDAAVKNENTSLLE